MLCPFCNGSGVNTTWVATDTVSEFKQTCFKCHGTGEVEQTNEEWLRSASANDMARCIATKLLELARHEYGIYDVVDYATIFEWLKQPHTDKE